MKKKLLSLVSQRESAQSRHIVNLLQAYRFSQLDLHFSTLSRLQKSSLSGFFRYRIDFPINRKYLNILRNRMHMQNTLIPRRYQLLLLRKFQTNQIRSELHTLLTIIHIIANNIPTIYQILIQTFHTQLHILTSQGKWHTLVPRIVDLFDIDIISSREKRYSLILLNHPRLYLPIDVQHPRFSVLINYRNSQWFLRSPRWNLNSIKNLNQTRPLIKNPSILFNPLMNICIRQTINRNKWHISISTTRCQKRCHTLLYLLISLLRPIYSIHLSHYHDKTLNTQCSCQHSMFLCLSFFLKATLEFSLFC